MSMPIRIEVMRKGAIYHIACVTNPQNHLSLCQIFESTDDVVSYTVTEIDMLVYTIRDRYLPDNTGFPKWRQATLPSKEK